MQKKIVHAPSHPISPITGKGDVRGKFYDKDCFEYRQNNCSENQSGSMWQFSIVNNQHLGEMLGQNGVLIAWQSGE